MYAVRSMSRLVLLFAASFATADSALETLNAIRPGSRARVNADEADKVHVVLLVYGKDGQFGAACRKDVHAFAKMLDQGFEQKADRLEFHDYTGLNPTNFRPWTPKEVLADLARMQVGTNDSIVLYHSGHGMIVDPKSPESSQIMVTNEGPIQRGDLLRVLNAHHPRGLVLLTDCCSSFPETPARHLTRTNLSYNAQTVQSLFLKVRGGISITAAEPGDGATSLHVGSNPGQACSDFTVALLRLMCNQDRSFANWSQLFPSLQQETADASSLQGTPLHRAFAFRLEEAGTVR
jgi:hypothetical protein